MSRKYIALFILAAIISGETPRIDRAFVVVTNSRDFGVTEDACNEMINKLIRVLH